MCEDAKGGGSRVLVGYLERTLNNVKVTRRVVLGRGGRVPVGSFLVIILIIVQNELQG